MGNCFGTRVISHYSPASTKPISSSETSKNHSSNKQQNGAPAASKGHTSWEQNGVAATTRINDSSSGKAVQVERFRSIPSTNNFNDEGPPPLLPSKGASTGKIITQNLKMFTLAELKSATRNFRPDTVLGEGGFGRVFRGWIDERTYAPSKVGVGMAVAVKKSNPDSSQGLREWQAEVKFLGKFSHPNLVKLLGYCWEEDQYLLVYEYMQKGSLENHLFRNGAEPLSWKIRLKIAIGAAEGLDFLHTSEKSVIYRDFKTSNILLDSDYNAKLSDFGLAKLGPINGNSHVTTRIMGTYGYAAPEYVATGHLYVKSDVYGFGVVLLELLTGLRALDPGRPSSEHNLVEWAKPSLSDKRKLKKIMDPRLNEQYTIKAAMQIAQLVLQCLESDPKSRPSMKEVLDALIEASAIREKTKESSSSSRVASQSRSSNNRGPEDRSSQRNHHSHHRSPLHGNATRVHPPSSSTRPVRHG